MPALILFRDNVLYICELKDIFVKGKICTVKYHDKRKYVARVLAVCKDKVDLQKLKASMEGQTAKTDQIWVRGDKIERSYVKLSREIVKSPENTVLFADKIFLSEKWNSLCLSKFLSSMQDPEFFNNPSYFVKFITVDKLDNKDVNQRKSKKRKKSRRGSIHPVQIHKRLKHDKDTENSEPSLSGIVNPQDPEDDRESVPDAGLSYTPQASSAILSSKNSQDDLIISTERNAYRKRQNFDKTTISEHENIDNTESTIRVSDATSTCFVVIKAFPEKSKTQEVPAAPTSLQQTQDDLNKEKTRSSCKRQSIFEELVIAKHETAPNTHNEGESATDVIIEQFPPILEALQIQEVSAASTQLQTTYDLNEAKKIKSCRRRLIFEEPAISRYRPANNIGQTKGNEIQSIPEVLETHEMPARQSQRQNNYDELNKKEKRIKSRKQSICDEESRVTQYEMASNTGQIEGKSGLGFLDGVKTQRVSRIAETEQLLAVPTQLQNMGKELVEKKVEKTLYSNEHNSPDNLNTEIPPTAAKFIKCIDDGIQAAVSNNPTLNETFIVTSNDSLHSLSAATSLISNRDKSMSLAEKGPNVISELKKNVEIGSEIDDEGKSADKGVSPEVSSSSPPEGLDTFIKEVTAIYHEQKVPVTESMIEELVIVYDRDLATKTDNGIEKKVTESKRSRDDDINCGVENLVAKENDNSLSCHTKSTSPPSPISPPSPTASPSSILPSLPSPKSRKNPQIIKTEIIKARYKLVQKTEQLVETRGDGKNPSIAHLQLFSNNSIIQNSKDDDVQENFGIPQAHSSLQERKEESTDRKRRFTPEEIEDFSEDGDSSDVYDPDKDDDKETDFEDFSSDGNAETDEEDNKQETKPIVPLDITHGDNAPISAPDDRDLRVDPSSSGVKKHFCIYCKKLQTKFARHLQLVHKDEEDVKKFMHLPAKNSERQKIIAVIRKKGDFLFNSDKELNNGSMIVCRRPNIRMNKTAEDFQVCGKCRGQYARSVIRHHCRQCFQHDGKKQRVVMVQGRKIAARVHPSASKDVRNKVYPYMIEDSVVKEIRYDPLVTIYANKMAEKYGTQGQSYKQVRANMRLCGRLLIAIKEIDNRIESFSQILTPEYYDAVLRAVRVVTRYDEDTKLYGAPAVASGYGTLLKKLAELLRNEYIKKKMPAEREDTDNFIKLLEVDYGISINHGVAETQAQNNRRKEIILPTTADVTKLYNFIKTERDKYYQQLLEKFSYKNWENLLKTTLLSLQIFNRRRPGEIERLYIEDFRSHRGLDHVENQEAYNGLSEEGKNLARKYSRFEIRGKLGRGVPVLIDKDVLDCLNYLIDHRKEAGIPDKNTYLFGLPSADKNRNRHLSAYDLMREYSVKCGAEAPESLRGTTLRKHIATKCIALNLTDGQVSDLANFMGHAEKIHKEFYRQPVLETDIVRISKILTTAQGLTLSEDESDSDGSRKHTVSCRPSDRSADNTGDGPSTSSSINSTTSLGKQPWSHAEKTVTLAAFEKGLKAGRVPSGREMQELINSNECMRARTVPQVRTWLWTQKKKMSKN